MGRDLVDDDVVVDDAGSLTRTFPIRGSADGKSTVITVSPTFGLAPLASKTLTTDLRFKEHDPINRMAQNKGGARGSFSCIGQ